MNLSKFPRPKDDSGIGIHFGSPTPRSIEKYLPILKAMRAKWVVLASESPDLIGRVAPILLENDIMPIARPQTMIDSRPNFASKARWCKSPYVQVFNEPGDDREWEHRRPKNWWEIFRRKWVAQAHRVRSEGCYPGLQVMNTLELKAMLKYMRYMGDEDLWPDMWLSIHAYPAHGCPPACTEHEDDLLSFLMYAKVCEEIMGFVPPVIITETAWTPSQAPPETRAKWTTDALGWFKHGRVPIEEWHHNSITKTYKRWEATLPDYLFAVCPWILFGRWLWFGFSWTDNVDNIPTLEAVKAMEPFTRYTGGEPPEEPRDWRVVSEWMTEDNVWMELLDLEGAGFHRYNLEEAT